ncbi:hypothetical protein AN159_02400 [Neisseria meningitidis]|nr:hypothetical protein AN159_02400 [Neisseria meningitidis]
MRDDFCILKAFFGVIREKSYPKSYPINGENSSIRQHIQGNKKALKLLKFKAFLCFRILLKIGYGGGGGDRTPVRKSSTKRSTYLVVSI